MAVDLFIATREIKTDTRQVTISGWVVSDIHHSVRFPGSVQMPTISTKDYLLDQAKRRLKPTPVTIPGMSLAEKRLRKHEWKQFPLAEPPAGSGLRPAMGDSGLPIIGHMIEFFRAGRSSPWRCTASTVRFTTNTHPHCLR